MRKIFTSVAILFLSVVAFGQIPDTTTTTSEEVELPTITLSESDFASDEGLQDISGLLQASRDIFVSTAGYTFGPARFRIRGYDSENLSVLMNGVPLNDMETGRAYWSSWGGLNDATRWKDIQTGIVSSEYAFGGVGGVTEIFTRPSSYRKQTKFSYSLANRSYRNRLMFTYASGEMENGWSVIASGSRRWANEGYVQGTFYDAWAYFIGIEKKVNKTHSFSLTVFGAPTKRGRSGISVQEAYDLTGNNYYNPYWGYQNGKKRNARVGNYHQPMITLTHYCDISENTKAQGAVSYWFGRGGTTALEWVEAGDPRPDYYRYLPSFWESIEEDQKADYYRNIWLNNEAGRQLQWDHMYFANSKFLFTVNDVDGIEGNDVTGLRSKYIIEDRRNDKSQLLVNWRIHSVISDMLKVSGGFDLTWYKGHQYKMVDDLLGGEYWFDIDKYADGDPFTFPDQMQSDLNHPNRIVKEGDIFGYDYTANINVQDIWGEADFSFSKIDFYAGLKLSHTTFWRTGHMRNGKFPDNSFGDSPKNNFFNYALKAGATYKINGRNYIVANGMFMTRAPYFRNSYISARTRDFTVDNLKNEKILSGDISYILHAPAIKARLTLYYTQFKDQTWSRSFYHDGLNTFVNYIMTGVDKLNTGAELGIEANVSPTITLTAVGGLGQFIYNSRPLATVARDNDAAIMATDRKVYLKNYYVGGMPQTIGSVGVKYNAPTYWFIGVNGNYFGNAYLQPNPDRRTAEAFEGLFSDDIRVKETLAQEKLPSALTMDLFGGKSWKVNHKYYIGFTLSVSNLLNNTNIATSGYEQYRYDVDNINKFAPKYSYLYGRTYFLNIYIRM